MFGITLLHYGTADSHVAFVYIVNSRGTLLYRGPGLRMEQKKHPLDSWFF